MLALLALLGTACDPAPPSDVASGEVRVTPVPAPTGEGAAEPNLFTDGEGVLLSWLQPEGSGSHSLRVAALQADGSFGPARTVVTRDDLFVNWADFPSVIRLADGRLAAHWLQRGEAGGYDYGVRVALSGDDGESWSEPWTPHEDGTPTEHGFVSMVPLDGGELGLLWLDGRRYVDSPAGPATEEMTLRSRVLGADGTPGPELLVDDRVCDCCQTSMARTSEGWVAVYRDRAGDEVRDIFAARWVNGTWAEGRPVHRDGWVIDACPVNGPQVDASGDHVAVAWFTAAANVPRVDVAFSDDAGAIFSEPVRVDDGNPVGRVDVVLEPSGAALVTWLERTAEGAEVRMRRVTPGDGAGPSVLVAATSAARSAGFPRMVPLAGGDVLAAWTDLTDEASRVRVVRVTPPAP